MSRHSFSTAAVTLLAAGFLSASVSAADEDLAKRADAARSTSMSFMQALKKELTRAMQAGGPTAAIEVCNARAAEIAAQASEATGWEVGRTALKLRNPDNAPDEWERDVLERFEARKAAGEDPASMEHYDVVDSGGGKTFRYMKAIPTATLCLSCHGAEIAAPVDATLHEFYPHDQARGFKAGDIRGAFTIAQPM